MVNYFTEKFMVPQKAELAQVSDVDAFLDTTTDFRHLVAVMDSDDDALREKARIRIASLLRSPRRQETVGSHEFLLDIAKNSAAPSFVLNRLADVKHYRLLNALVCNRNLPGEAAHKIAASGSATIPVKRRLVRNRNLPDDAWKTVVEKYPPILWATICFSAHTPGWVLREMFNKLLPKQEVINGRDYHVYPLQRLAKNPNLPADIIKYFSEKVHAEIEKVDMFAPAAPFGHSLGLLDDPSYKVFQNPSLPSNSIRKSLDIATAEWLLRGSYKPQTGTMMVNLLQNPSIGDDVLKEYEAMNNMLLTTYLVKNRKASAELLRQAVENDKNSESIKAFCLKKLSRVDASLKNLPVEWVESMFDVKLSTSVVSYSVVQ